MNKTAIADYERGWVEALIDGEGSLTLVKEKRLHFTAQCTFKPQLSIGNRDIRLLERAQKIMGGGAICTRRRDGMHYLVANSGVLRDFLPAIDLITKENQRLALIQAIHILSRHAGRGHPRTANELNSLHLIYVIVRRDNGRNAI